MHTGMCMCACIRITTTLSIDVFISGHWVTTSVFCNLCFFFTSSPPLHFLPPLSTNCKLFRKVSFLLVFQRNQEIFVTENQFLISHSVVVCTHAWRSCWKLILASNVIEVFFFFSVVLVRQGVGKTDFWRMIHVNRKQEIKMEMEAGNRKDYSTWHHE